MHRNVLGTNRVAVDSETGDVLVLYDGSYIPDLITWVILYTNDALHHDAMEDIRRSYKFESTIRDGRYSIYFYTPRESNGWIGEAYTEKRQFEAMRRFAQFKHVWVIWSIVDPEDGTGTYNDFRVCTDLKLYPVTADSLAFFAISLDEKFAIDFYSSGGIVPTEAMDKAKELLS